MLPNLRQDIFQKSHTLFGRVRLYQADCMGVMDHYIEHFGEEGCFDMIFADPPYFLSNGGTTCHAGKRVRVDKGEWDRSQGADLNHAFNLDWLSRCQKLLRPDGTLWVSGTHHIIHSVGFAMQQLGMKILNTVIWQKPNPPPNLSCRYFTHSFETLLWAAKSEKSKHVFNYPVMRQENGGMQMKDIWTIPSREKTTNETGCEPSARHPTQKPIALLERIVRAGSHRNDLIFDPFAGSASTGVAALLNDRQFVGCELEPEYFRLAVSRLQKFEVVCP
ncbi:MAG: site-specific DNA-methyltransferase [Ectothiorhodospiraceae bacterium AqS1]|nr:site-specific DNA-methyltransferase [Ectothiorhodospiraceae bacterium AqS1]